MTCLIRAPYGGCVSPPQTAEKRGFIARFKSLRRRIRAHRVGLILWRAMIIVVSTVVIAIGIVLLAIPGPGWLIIFAGLGILSSEFTWAARLLRFARRQVSRWTHWVADRGRGVQILLGALGLLILAAVVAGGWWLYF
jgi:uncharacterized protein (TIGR02611 family)